MYYNIQQMSQQERTKKVGKLTKISIKVMAGKKWIKISFLVKKEKRPEATKKCVLMLTCYIKKYTLEEKVPCNNYHTLIIYKTQKNKEKER